MGQHVIVAIPLDSTWHVEADKDFGGNLISVIQERGNPNIPSHPHGVHGAQLGPQFCSSDTLLIAIESGAIVRLSIEEQIHLERALAKFRKKQLKQKSGS